MQKDLLGEIPAKKSAPAALELSPANALFEEFWQLKPARAGDNPKGKARESFLKLLAGGVKPDMIINATRQWAEQIRKDGDEGKRFVPMAVTWLNQQRFDGYTVKTAEDRAEINAMAEAHGWQWDGTKYVKVADQPKPEPVFAPRRAFTVEDRATLFCPSDLPWYHALVERHEASDKKSSYYGRSRDGTMVGIWVTPEWHGGMGHAISGLRFHHLNVPATEILPTFVSGLADTVNIETVTPPLEAYADILGDLGSTG